jgi:transposase-like protein
VCDAWALGCGCDDAAVETGPLGTRIDFAREASSLAEAIGSAVRDVEKAPGLRAVGVACDNMVTLRDIAERIGVDRETVRLWATGQRGPGGFPAPELITPAGEKIWDWDQVAPWIGQHQHRAAFEIGRAEAKRIMGIADRVLAARAALRSEPDDSVREEQGRLLQDA